MNNRFVATALVTSLVVPVYGSGVSVTDYPSYVSSYSNTFLPTAASYASNTTQVSFIKAAEVTAMNHDVLSHLNMFPEARHLIDKVNSILELSLGVVSQAYSMWQDPETGKSKVYWSIFTNLEDDLDAFEDALFEKIEQQQLVQFLKYVIIHLE
jgi:hypothetical protein